MHQIWPGVLQEAVPRLLMAEVPSLTCPTNPSVSWPTTDHTGRSQCPKLLPLHPPTPIRRWGISHLAAFMVLVVRVTVGTRGQGDSMGRCPETLTERNSDPPLNLREQYRPYPGSLSLTEEVQGSWGPKLGSTGTSLSPCLVGAGQCPSSSYGTVWGPGGNDGREGAEWPAAPGVPKYGTSASTPEGPMPSCCHGQCPPASLSSWSKDRAARSGCLRVG